MILNMEKLTVYCLSKEKEALISGLMKHKCVELLDSAERLPQSEEGFPLEKKEIAVFNLEQKLSRYAAALMQLSKYKKKDSLFARRKHIAFADYGNEEILGKGEALCREAEQAFGRMTELKSELSRLSFTLTALKPWEASDLPLDLRTTSRCSMQYLVIVKDEETESVVKILEETGGELFEVSQDEEHYYFILICHNNDRIKLEEVLKELGLSGPDLENLTGTAMQNRTDMKALKEEYLQELEEIEKKLGEMATDLEALKLAHDSLAITLDCKKAEENLLHTEKTFVLTGWVPERDKETIGKFLEKHNCFYTFDLPEEGEEPPILLKNNKLMEPFEAVTEMYALPKPSELDPGPLLAPFFFVFFGMMLSDAGYGLILLLGGWFAIKKIELSNSMQKLVKLLMLSGISTVIFGLLFGGFFGDIIPVILDTFFGIQWEMPALINPLYEPMLLLGISCGLGLFHLFFGMGIQAYMLIKRGKWKDAVYDIGFWYLLIIGLLLLVPDLTRIIGGVMAVGGVLGLLLTQGREKPTLVGKIIGGLGGLYNITGYLSDVLSYSRILALGLATGVIAQVINLMGSLPGPNFFGVVLLLIVFPLGHALNLVINALGSYVHSSRLQYVEFFGKFYEGGGKPFAPLRPDTKYTFVLEDEDNETTAIQ